MFTHILVPIDFSAPSTAALAHARRLAGTFGASLHLLTTPTPGEIGGDLTIPATGSEPSSKKVTAVRLSSLP